MFGAREVSRRERHAFGTESQPSGSPVASEPVLPELPSDDEMRISTRRLELVPLTAADADDLFPLLNDPAVGAFTGEIPPADVEAVRARFELWEARRSPGGAELWLNWVVRLKDDSQAVGLTAATVGEDDTAIAWIVGTAYQRRASRPRPGTR